MSQYGPDEDPLTILAEKGWLQGAIVGGVAYGVDFTLAVFTLALLCRQPPSGKKTFHFILIGFTALVFIFATFFMGSLAQFTQMAFIDNRNYPGGPNQYEIDQFHVWQSELGNVSFVFGNWLCDAMIVWRFLVIYKGVNFPMWLVGLLPGLVCLASIVLGSLWLRQITTTSPFADGRDWTIPYLSVSLALNILMTIAIVLRLFVHRQRVKRTLGADHAAHYTTVAAMIIESAAVYSSFSIAFLVLFGLQNPISTVFLQSLVQVQVASALLIIFRVAQGRAFGAHASSSIHSTNRLPSIQLASMGRQTYSRGDTAPLSPTKKLNNELDVHVSRQVESFLP